MKSLGWWEIQFRIYGVGVKLRPFQWLLVPVWDSHRIEYSPHTDEWGNYWGNQHIVVWLCAVITFFTEKK